MQEDDFAIIPLYLPIPFEISSIFDFKRKASSSSENLLTSVPKMCAFIPSFIHSSYTPDAHYVLGATDVNKG